MASADQLFDRALGDLSDTWQARALRDPRCGFRLVNGGLFALEPLGAVLLSVFAQQWDEALFALLLAVFPGFRTLMPPFLVEAGKINKYGIVTAKAFMAWGPSVEPAAKFQQLVLFENEKHMEYHFRRLADRLKLSDADRWQLFSALKFWIVQDRRLDPAMDPADPDAKRLVSH